MCTLLRRKELALKAREKRKAEQLGLDPELLDNPLGDDQRVQRAKDAVLHTLS